MKYWEQLQDPRWQEVRLKVLNRANFCCEVCADKPEGQSLEIHHRYYEKGLMAWEYPEDSLVCVCKDCHEEAAACERVLLRVINPRDSMNLRDLAWAIFQAYEYGIGIRKCAELIEAGVKKAATEITSKGHSV